MKTVFNKDITPACRYCSHGTVLSYSNEIICERRGVTAPSDFCRHYSYDPLKRIPTKPMIKKNYNKKDFLI